MGRIAKSKLRSRDGFTQNNGNVWGHCEHTTDYECFNRTLYKCDVCNMFVCADHQKNHIKEDHAK